jgi:hypothetical protein
MLARPTLFAPGLLAAALSCGACSKPVDLKQALQVTDVSSGWFDAGIVAGKNKLVPSVTFRLKKPADVDLSNLSLNMVFKPEGDAEGDDVFVQRVEWVNQTETAPITVRSKFGFTADPPQSRLEMLKHSQFRDSTVQIFAKLGSSQWVELQSVKVARQLLTQ